MGLVIQNTTIRLTDLLLPTQYEIVDLDATSVTFLGPAIMMMQGSVKLAGESQFLNDMEDILWDLPAGKTSVVGVVGLTNPSFTDCRFQGIGIAGDHASFTQLLGRTTV
ncbi:hypothetical protein J3D45_000030 [Microbacterium foliorum]|uniref:hypothetical protein n=1 Tax=Microbacterium foliorum TaxID=104336 RepID=UPI0020A06402|nr:hypothetical protein [Microbacterium foliorum]MCP1427532.1 hypothetical protein [Microbacterium foliorum]